MGQWDQPPSFRALSMSWKSLGTRNADGERASPLTSFLLQPSRSLSSFPFYTSTTSPSSLSTPILPSSLPFPLCDTAALPLPPTHHLDPSLLLFPFFPPDSTLPLNMTVCKHCAIDFPIHVTPVCLKCEKVEDLCMTGQGEMAAAFKVSSTFLPSISSLLLSLARLTFPIYALQKNTKQCINCSKCGGLALFPDADSIRCKSCAAGEQAGEPASLPLSLFSFLLLCFLPSLTNFADLSSHFVFA